MNLQKVNGKPIKSGNIRFLTRSETLRDHSSTTVVRMELKLAARLVYDILLMPTCPVFAGPVTNTSSNGE